MRSMRFLKTKKLICASCSCSLKHCLDRNPEVLMKDPRGPLLLTLAASTAAQPAAHHVACGGGRRGENRLDSRQQHDGGNMRRIAPHGGRNHDGVAGSQFGERHGRQTVEHLTDIPASATSSASWW